MPWAAPKVTLEITDILDESERGIQVVSRRTGATPWLPKDCLDYLPGAVRVPEWLMKKFKKRKGGDLDGGKREPSKEGLQD